MPSVTNYIMFTSCQNSHHTVENYCPICDRSFKTVKLPARVKTLLRARLLTNGIGYKEEEEL